MNTTPDNPFERIEVLQKELSRLDYMQDPLDRDPTDPKVAARAAAIQSELERLYEQYLRDIPV